MNTDEQHNEPVISDEELKMPEETFGSFSSEESRPALGFVLAALIIILILILGGLYLWSQNLTPAEPIAPTPTRPTAEQNNEPESTNAEAEVETFQAMSTSDELGAIAADLEATDLDSLDADLNAIDVELNSSTQ